MKKCIAVAMIVMMGLLVKDCDGIRLANSPFAENGVLGGQNLAQVQDPDGIPPISLQAITAVKKSMM